MQDLETLFLSLERLHLEPQTRHQPEVLAALLANDFYEFGASGRVWTKADALQRLAQPEPTAHRLMTEYKLIKLSDDVMLMTYLLTHSDTGSSEIVKSRRSSVWKRNAASAYGWQLHFHQGTLSSD